MAGRTTRGLDEPPGPTISKQRQQLKLLRRRIRTALFALLNRALPRPTPRPLPRLAELERVLLVQVSERLGHALLLTPGLDELLDALGGARVVLVGGPHAPAVVEGYRLDRIEVLSRRDWLRPWRFVQLLRRLRAERFDAAIHLGTSSRSVGPAIVGLSGARHRIGRERGRRSLFYTAPIARGVADHKVDIRLEFLAALGVPATGERRLRLQPEELAAARARLDEALPGRGSRPVALLVGGRAGKGKDWPLENFARVASDLRRRGIPPIVVLGPEERPFLREARAAIGAALYVDDASIREVAALLACCGAVLSLDSGTLHLAIASGAPTVAVFRKPNFHRWGPRPPLGEIVYDPAGNDAGAALEALLRLYGEDVDRRTPALHAARAARSSTGS